MGRNGLQPLRDAAARRGHWPSSGTRRDRIRAQLGEASYCAVIPIPAPVPRRPHSLPDAPALADAIDEVKEAPGADAKRGKAMANANEDAMQEM